jgi:hypothetical protein
VLRPDANPQFAYEDGRIEKLFELVESMAIHLKTFNMDTWVYINHRIQEIFKKAEETMEAEYKATKARREEEGNY